MTGVRSVFGIDVGGTFTDFVAYDPKTRKIEVWKELSTPGDPVTGIVCRACWPRRSTRSANLRLGTTVATNAILERKGAIVAYVTTKGFRDVPFIQRGNRKFHYDMSWVKPKPLVKRRHCFELNERIDAYGQVVTPLDEAEVRARGEGDRGDPGDRGGRRLPPVLLPQPGARAARQGDPRRGAARHADLDLLRRAAEVEGIRARLDHASPTPISSRSSADSCRPMRGRLDEAG